ncbi:MAG: glycosyltransferase family 4 protein [Thermodesulfovibrionales bacterium]|nr:glycosyltransferase family 4 protein [Thermodesulfovibrionales bacterium]
MKPLKIIHLSVFNPSKPPHHADRDDDYYFVSSWAGLIARRLKKYNPGLDIESWRAESDFSEITEKEVFNIQGVIWPYRKPVVKNILTWEMIKKLNELKKRFYVILHYHDLYNLRFVMLVKLLCPGIKLVLSHHGGIPPRKGSMKSALMKIFYNKKIISYITYLTLATKMFFELLPDHPPLKFMPVGADFDSMKPKNLPETRMKLGLEPEKIYALYVGRFYRLKGVDLILKVYHALKDKYNFSVIFVGGSNDEDNDLYDAVVGSGCPYFGVQFAYDMPQFFNAADFYIHPAFNPKFGGLDVSWMEALACNKPVISPQLANLDFDYSELGVLIKDESEVLGKTEWMINNHKKFTKCRTVAQEHLDGNTVIMDKLAKIYEEIYR